MLVLLSKDMKALILSILIAFGSIEDRGDARREAQAAELSEAMESVRPPGGVSVNDWRALILAVGMAETHFALRIHDGQCKAWECDRGLARGPFQQHMNAHVRKYWDRLTGVENTKVQVRVADAALKRAYYTCGRTGLAGAINAYAGKRCDAMWPGLTMRLALQKQIARRLG